MNGGLADCVPEKLIEKDAKVDLRRWNMEHGTSQYTIKLGSGKSLNKKSANKG